MATMAQTWSSTSPKDQAYCPGAADGVLTPVVVAPGETEAGSSANTRPGVGSRR